MRLGAGLPNPIPDTPARSLVEWAARAEALGFASVATIDRVAFPGHEPLTCLAAAAVAGGGLGRRLDVGRLGAGSGGGHRGAAARRLGGGRPRGTPARRRARLL